jgi:hypothetical protein
MILRYEWRAWGDEAAQLADRITVAATFDHEQHSIETYVVSKDTTSTNAKVRNGMLDVKVLRRTSHGFEQWEPLDKQPFPIPMDPVARELLQRLGVVAPGPGRTKYTLDALVADIIDPQPRLAAVEIEKRRRLFAHRGCILEIAELSMDRTRARSVAIESADLDSLRAAADSLRFTSAPNVSYPKMIHRVLGWVDREE